MGYKLSISNIAWSKKEDELVYTLMEKHGFLGLEIAPGKVWDKPYEQSEESINLFKKEIAQKGLSIVAMQSLLFGMPNLAIFQDESSRAMTLDVLKKNIILGGKLGAKALIFGSPKNRIVGTMPKGEALSIAVDFFKKLGDLASENSTYFCIEPNPTIYGGDFIVSTVEAIELVKQVQHPNFKLNIDLGTITANNEPLEATLSAALPYAGHMHISEPFLEKIVVNENKHKKIKKVLDDFGYNLNLSIEMKSSGGQESNIAGVEEVLKFVSHIYR